MIVIRDQITLTTVHVHDGEGCLRDSAEDSDAWHVGSTRDLDLADRAGI